MAWTDPAPSAPSITANWTRPELRFLSSFHLSRSIMDPGTRRSLVRAWAFCGRHAWMAAISLVAAQYSALGTVVLYDDLMRRAERALRGPTIGLARRLSGRGPCLVCDFIETAGDAIPLTPGDRRLLRMGRPSFLLERSRAFWEPSICGRCRSAGSGTGGVWCRLHVIESVRSPAPASDQIDQALPAVADIRRGLRRYLHERDVTRFREQPPAVEASWVQAVGWANGWAGLLAFLGELA